MKIEFQNDSSGTLVTNVRDPRCVMSFVIICFFAGVCATWFIEREFGLSVAAVSAGAILATCALCFSTKKIRKCEPRSRRRNKSESQMAFSWDYRPKLRTLEYFNGGDTRAGTRGALDLDASNMECHDVWFDFGTIEPNTTAPCSTSGLLAVNHDVP